MELGFITLGKGTEKERTLRLMKRLSGTFIDDRKLSIYEVEDGNYYFRFENPIESGRNVLQELYLSKETFAAFQILQASYFNKIKLNLDEFMKSAIDENIKHTIEYYFVDDPEFV